jgi:hypothetical protein
MNVNVWMSISHIATGLWEDPKPKAFFLPWEQVWPSCYKWQVNKWSSKFPLWLEIWCWFILQKQRWNEQWKWRTGPENMWWLTIKVVICTHKILSLLADNWVMFPPGIQIRWDDSYPGSSKRQAAGISASISKMVRCSVATPVPRA